MWAAHVTFDSRNGLMDYAGIVHLGQWGTFAAYAASLGYTEQIGTKPGTPWRNPTTGKILLLIFQGEDSGECANRSLGINSALNQIKGVMHFLSTWDG